MFSVVELRCRFLGSLTLRYIGQLSKRVVCVAKRDCWSNSKSDRKSIVIGITTFSMSSLRKWGYKLCLRHFSLNGSNSDSYSSLSSVGGLFFLARTPRQPATGNNNCTLKSQHAQAA